MSVTDWTEAIPEGLGQREPEARSMRWPKELALEVEAIAEETGQHFSVAALHLLKAAVFEFRKTHAKKRKAS